MNDEYWDIYEKSKKKIIYRVNDSFNLSTTHKINREIMNDDEYNNTILRKFLETYDKKKPN